MKNENYGASYFEFQDPIGKKTVRLKDRFQPYISIDSTVLDFGCGAGYLLDSIECKNKIGVDINPLALNEASKKGIKTFNTLKDVKNDSIDCIISNSTFGHLSNPIEILTELKSKLKIGGMVIFSIPHETINFKFKQNDINQIFYTWSPMSLGNLFKNLGFEVIEVKIYKEIYFPNETNIQNEIIIIALNFFRPLYRIFRLVIEELGILRLGRDGNIILYSRKIS